MINRPPTSRTCSDETRDALRRARERVDDIPISDRTAFALLQVELGRDLEALREKLELDAQQMVALRMRVRRPPPVARGKGTRKRKRRGEPPAAAWR